MLDTKRSSVSKYQKLKERGHLKEKRLDGKFRNFTKLKKIQGWIRHLRSHAGCDFCDDHNYGVASYSSTILTFFVCQIGRL